MKQAEFLRILIRQLDGDRIVQTVESPFERIGGRAYEAGLGKGAQIDVADKDDPAAVGVGVERRPSVTALPKATNSSGVEMPFQLRRTLNDAVSSSAETAANSIVPAPVQSAPSAGAVTLSTEFLMSSAMSQPLSAVMSHVATLVTVQGMSRCSPKANL